MEPGKPLSFLEHRIHCGNSLLGSTPALLAKGIPDEAFQRLRATRRKHAAKWRKVNKSERKAAEIGAAKFAFEDYPWLKLGNFAQTLLNLDNLADDTIENVRTKTALYERAVRSGDYMEGKLLADAWSAAFVWPKNSLYEYPITEEVFRRIERNPHGCERAMRDGIDRLSRDYRFFHWHLAFPMCSGFLRPIPNRRMTAPVGRAGSMWFWAIRRGRCSLGRRASTSPQSCRRLRKRPTWRLATD